MGFFEGTQEPVRNSHSKATEGLLYLFSGLFRQKLLSITFELLLLPQVMLHVSSITSIYFQY